MVWSKDTRKWTCSFPLSRRYTIMGVGKERRTLIGPWWPAKAAPVTGTALRATGPVPMDSWYVVDAIGTQLRDPINSGLARDGMAEPVSRNQILRCERGQENINFPSSAGHMQDLQTLPGSSMCYGSWSTCCVASSCCILLLNIKTYKSVGGRDVHRDCWARVEKENKDATRLLETSSWQHSSTC